MARSRRRAVAGGVTVHELAKAAGRRHLVVPACRGPLDLGPAQEEWGRTVVCVERTAGHLMHLPGDLRPPTSLAVDLGAPGHVGLTLRNEACDVVEVRLEVTPAGLRMPDGERAWKANAWSTSRYGWRSADATGARVAALVEDPAGRLRLLETVRGRCRSQAWVWRAEGLLAAERRRQAGDIGVAMVMCALLVEGWDHRTGGGGGPAGGPGSGGARAGRPAAAAGAGWRPGGRAGTDAVRARGARGRGPLVAVRVVRRVGVPDRGGVRGARPSGSTRSTSPSTAAPRPRVRSPRPGCAAAGRAASSPAGRGCRR